MKLYYEKNSTASIGWRKKGDYESLFMLTLKPTWNFGNIDYVSLDIDSDVFDLE